MLIQITSHIKIILAVRDDEEPAAEMAFTVLKNYASS